MIAGDAVELFVRKTCRNVVMLHVLVIYLRIKFKTTTTTTRTKKVHMQKSIHVLGIIIHLHLGRNHTSHTSMMWKLVLKSVKMLMDK